MTEERALKRMHVISYLKVSERNTEQSIGQVVDITSEGMRLYSKEPLQPETDWQFSMALNENDENARDVTFDAVVIWCKKAHDRGYYDMGIQLRNVSEHDSKTIERLCQDSSYVYIPSREKSTTAQ